MNKPIGTALRLPGKIATAAKVLLNRSIIAISGPDAAHFLNGLLTVQPEAGGGVQSSPQYCGLLNAKGRFVADMMLYRAHGNPLLEKHLVRSANDESYLLDIDSRLSEKLLYLLDFYKLQTAVSLNLVNTLKSLATWDDLAEEPTARLSSQSTCISSFDPRIPEMGALHLCDEGSLMEGVEYQTEEDYTLRRYLFGISAGPEEILQGKSLPLECNLDYLNGVNFTKGCYVGQELTIRSHHNNTVRKRIVPVILAAPGTEPDFDDPYRPIRITAPDAVAENIEVVGQEGKSAGQLVALMGNVGLATVRLNSLDQPLLLKGVTVDGTVQPQSVHTMTPFWWPAPEAQEQP